MKRKSVFKFLINIAFLTVLSFVFRFGYDWGGSPYIFEGVLLYSDAQIRERIKDDVGIIIPTEAGSLYYSYENRDGAHCYVALKLWGHDACDEFFKSQFSISTDDFKKAEYKSVSLEEYNKIVKFAETHLRGGCGSLTDSLRRRGDWELSKYDEFYAYENSDANSLLIVYVPEESRIFVYRHYPNGLPCLFCRVLGE